MCANIFYNNAIRNELIFTKIEYMFNVNDLFGGFLAFDVPRALIKEIER